MFFNDPLGLRSTERDVGRLALDGGRNIRAGERDRHLHSIRERVGATACHHYDRRGNEIHTLDAHGDHFRLYDAAGRLLKSQSLGTIGLPDSSHWVTFTHDAAGNLTRVADPDVPGDQTALAYDARNLLSSATDAWGATTSYAYDAAGQVLQRTAPGIGSMSYAYDPAGHLTSLQDPAGNWLSYGYDHAGRLIGKWLPNNTHVHYLYDAAGRLTALRNRRYALSESDEAVIADYAYAYDGAGRKTSETRPDGTLTYTYDAIGRLAEVRQGGTMRRYEFDLDSNRSARKLNGAVSRAYTYNALDQLLEIRDGAGALTDSFTYSAAGEVTTHVAGASTRTYAYDAHQQVVREEQGGASASYVLDGLDRVIRRTKRDAGGAVTRDQRLGYGDLGDSRISETDAGSGLVEASYVIDPGGLLATRTAAGTINYHYFSGHGDLVQTLDPLGSVFFSSPIAYEEFGLPQGQAATPYGYTGQWQRETSGLAEVIRMGARLYDPAIGRFLSRDPVEGGSLGDYDYAAADPINVYDLDGRQPEWSCSRDNLGQLAGGAGGSVWLCHIWLNEYTWVKVL